MKPLFFNFFNFFGGRFGGKPPRSGEGGKHITYIYSSMVWYGIVVDHSWSWFEPYFRGEFPFDYFNGLTD